MMQHRQYITQEASQAQYTYIQLTYIIKKTLSIIKLHRVFFPHPRWKKFEWRNRCFSLSEKKKEYCILNILLKVVVEVCYIFPYPLYTFLSIVYFPVFCIFLYPFYISLSTVYFPILCIFLYPLYISLSSVYFPILCILPYPLYISLSSVYFPILCIFPYPLYIPSPCR